MEQVVENLVEDNKAPVYIVHFTQMEAAQNAQNFTSINVCTKDEKKQIAELLREVRFTSPYVKDIKNWPKIDSDLILKEKIKMAIQFNGKTREIIEVVKGVSQIEVINICKNITKIKEKTEETNIKKIIFVQDRIINFILKK